MAKKKTAVAAQTTRNLDDATWDFLRMPVHNTWQAIGNDICNANDEGGEGPLTNAVAVEVTLDANYMSMYGGPNGKEADEEFGRLIEKFGYDKVHKWVCTKANLA